ncbi:MAG: hypothetical protein AB7K71_35250, partial [Polyangiaceae bacterium]
MAKSPAVLAPVSAVGASFLATAQIVGGMGVMFGRIVTRAVRFDFDYSELVNNMHNNGVKTLPNVIVTAHFTRGNMIIQAAPIVERYGAQCFHGWAPGIT